MKAVLIGLALVCLTVSGCHRAEQQRTQAYEAYLKQTLGVVGVDDAAVSPPPKPVDEPGHAVPAN